jgi:hydroxypyruvate isomerase
MMIDCYHVQIMEGDVTRRLEALLPLIGPHSDRLGSDRGIPDHGELDYRFVLRRISELGWARPVGAEYLPSDGEEPDMAWLTRARVALDGDR